MLRCCSRHSRRRRACAMASERRRPSSRARPARRPPSFASSERDRRRRARSRRPRRRLAGTSSRPGPAARGAVRRRRAGVVTPGLDQHARHRRRHRPNAEAMPRLPWVPPGRWALEASLGVEPTLGDCAVVASEPVAPSSAERLCCERCASTLGAWPSPSTRRVGRRRVACDGSCRVRGGATAAATRPMQRAPRLSPHLAVYWRAFRARAAAGCPRSLRQRSARRSRGSRVPSQISPSFRGSDRAWRRRPPTPRRRGPPPPRPPLISSHRPPSPLSSQPNRSRRAPRPPPPPPRRASPPAWRARRAPSCIRTVWRSAAAALNGIDTFLVLGTGPERSARWGRTAAPHPTLLATALDALQPKRVRFVMRGRSSALATTRRPRSLRNGHSASTWCAPTRMPRASSTMCCTKDGPTWRGCGRPTCERWRRACRRASSSAATMLICLCGASSGAPSWRWRRGGCGATSGAMGGRRRCYATTSTATTSTASSRPPSPARASPTSRRRTRPNAGCSERRRATAARRPRGRTRAAGGGAQRDCTRRGVGDRPPRRRRSSGEWHDGGGARDGGAACPRRWRGGGGCAVARGRRRARRHLPPARRRRPVCVRRLRARAR